MRILIEREAHTVKEFFLSANKKQIAAVLLIIVFVFIFPSALRNANEKNREIDGSRAAIGESMILQMDRLSAIGVRMQYAGADIKNDMLPQIRLYCHSLGILNNICYKSFGEKYTPIDMGFINHLSNAVNELEACYHRGENAASCEKTLAEYLLKLDDIMNARFDDEMDILPLKK